MESKPWIDGSLEILDLAIELYYMGTITTNKNQSNKYLRIALIMADDAVELGSKAFFEFEIGKQKKGNLYNFLDWFKTNEPYKSNGAFHKLEPKLRYYHKQRNRLYHESYSPLMSRLEVLDFLECCYAYFKLIYETKLDPYLKTYQRRQFLFSFLELEIQVVSLCKNKGVALDDDYSINDLVLSLESEKILDGETRQLVEQANQINEKIIPTMNMKGIDLYSISSDLPELIKTIKDKRK